ncbi:MAG: hypothetical protein R2712_31295 [Vicinamibacterales bacterium]
MAPGRRGHAAGAAPDEFDESLDAFPIEYGEIIDTHVVLAGSDPFAGILIDTRDVRRAVEAQAASHLVHLRENYIEHGGRPGAIEALVHDSAPGFASLLRRMAAWTAPPSTPRPRCRTGPRPGRDSTRASSATCSPSPPRPPPRWMPHACFPATSPPCASCCA